MKGAVSEGLGSGLQNRLHRFKSGRHLQKSIAYANANIALIKYWGKKDEENNIPLVPSISMTLDGFGTKAVLEIAQKDELFINNKQADIKAFLRYKDFLNKARKIYNFTSHIKAKTTNDIPYGAGLASSASSYAAISKALDKLVNLNLTKKELSSLARLGSASAARSIFNNFAALENKYAYEIKSNLNLKMLILLVSSKQKAISSRDAMKISKSSPFLKAFAQYSHEDFKKAKIYLKEENFEKLGEVMEFSTLKMHSVMLSSSPSIFYIKPKSLEIINKIYNLRKDIGNIAYFTLDAGPNVKILIESQNLLTVKEYIKKNFPKLKILVSSPGKGAYDE